MGRLVEGSPNVIVGEISTSGGGNGGGGSRAGDAAGGGGGGNGSGGAARPEQAGTASSARSLAASKAATGSAGDAQARAQDATKTHHVELELEDADGRPLAGATYKLVAPDGAVHTGTLDGTGKARVDQLPEGTCEVSFTSLGNNPRSSV
jgi:hypothetical protein